MVTHDRYILFLKIYFNIHQVHPVNVYWPFIEYLMKIFLSKYLNENMRRQLILNTVWWFIKIFNSPRFINTYFMGFNHFQVSSTFHMIRSYPNSISMYILDIYDMSRRSDEKVLYLISYYYSYYWCLI